MKEFELGYLTALIDTYATYLINYNKVSDVRCTYDPVIQICLKDPDHQKFVSEKLVEIGIPHSVKTYTSYKLIVITSNGVVNNFFLALGLKLRKTPRLLILEEFVLLRVSKMLQNQKARYSDEERDLWRKMSLLGKKTEFVKAERINA